MTFTTTNEIVLTSPVEIFTSIPFPESRKQYSWLLIFADET